MKWTQHQNNSRYDAKVRRLIKKHGPTGYGVYWLLNESIAEKLDENLECLLEHDLESFSDEINCSEQIVRQVLDYCLEIGLITKQGEKYQNKKILKYADKWTKDKLGIKSLISNLPVTAKNLPVTYKKLQSTAREGSEGSEEYEGLEVKPGQTATDFFKEKEKARIASVKAQQDKALKDFLEGK
jgi:hypothetical protein